MDKKTSEIHQLALTHIQEGALKRYTDEQKRAILEAVLVKGMPKGRAAKEFGVSRQIIWKWIRIFADGNGTFSKSREEVSCPEER